MLQSINPSVQADEKTKPPALFAYESTPPKPNEHPKMIKNLDGLDGGRSLGMICTVIKGENGEAFIRHWGGGYSLQEPLLRTQREDQSFHTAPRGPVLRIAGADLHAQGHPLPLPLVVLAARLDALPRVHLHPEVGRQPAPDLFDEGEHRLLPGLLQDGDEDHLRGGDGGGHDQSGVVGATGWGHITRPSASPVVEDRNLQNRK